jgi:fucose permease
MQINHIAVLVSAVVYFVLGGLWFSVLFGKAWLKAIGKTEDEIKAEGGAGVGYAVSIIGGVLAAYILTVILNHVGADSLLTGVRYGFYVWLGFSVTSVAPTYIFESRNKTLLYIYAGYTLVGYLLMGGILAVWR